MPFAHDIYGVAVVLVDEISHFSMSLNLVGLGRYRVILHADIIHLKRADGNGIDALLHVEPDARKCKERAMLVVFNQNPHVSVNTTLRVPLYYSGLDSVASVSVQGAATMSDRGHTAVCPLSRRAY